jgi:hypothetical protein
MDAVQRLNGSGFKSFGLGLKIESSPSERRLKDERVESTPEPWGGCVLHMG